MKSLLYWVAGIATVTFAVMSGSGDAWAAERRVALVVGNAAYNTASMSLSNPRNDAEDISAVLRELDFRVVTAINATRRDMELKLQEFARLAVDADAALFFYAGHAMQYQGRNFLMPIDAQLEDEFSVRFQMVALEEVNAALERVNGVRILILDACRNNPLADRLQKTIVGASRSAAMTRGLARVDKTQGMVVAYATAANDVANDGQGRNSPFTAALLKRLREPGLEIELMFRRVASDVDAQTGHRQHPEHTVSLLSEYYLNQSDRIVWERINQDDVAALRDFANKFPSSPLGIQARNRLDLLERYAREREEMARRVREEEQRRQAEEADAKRRDELKRQEEQKRIAALEEQKRQEEQKRIAALEEQKRQEEQKRIAALEAQKRQEEQKRVAALEEQKRQEEQKRIAVLDDQKRLEEQKRVAALEEQKRQEEQKRIAALDDQKRLEEQKRVAALEEQKRQEEQKRIAALDDQKRLEEQKRVAALEGQKRQEEQKRVAALEEQKRVAVLEEQKRQEEQKRIAAQDDQKRQEEQKRVAALEEQRRQDEQKRLEEQKRIAALPADAPTTKVQPSLAAPPGPTTQPVTKANLPEQIRKAQTELKRLGCFDGDLDGKMSTTGEAIKAFWQRSHKPIVEINITDDFIGDLQRHPDEFCVPPSKKPPAVATRPSSPHNKGTAAASPPPATVPREARQPPPAQQPARATAEAARQQQPAQQPVAPRATGIGF